MRRLLLPLLMLSLLVTSACSGPTPLSAASDVPLASGMDTASFDRSVRPQDDLFRYANGGWLARTEIPADRASYGSFHIANDRTLEQLRAIAERSTGAPGSDAAKIADFYASFIDEARVDALGRKPLDAELAAIDALRTKADLARYWARAMRRNGDSPFGAFVEPDAKQPTHNILYLFQGGISLPDRDYYLEDDEALKGYRAKFVEYATRMLTLVGQPAPEAAAKDILALETRLARSHWTNVESRDAVKTYNKVAIADLPAQFPGFDWATWVKELTPGTSTALVIAQPSYAKDFAAAVAELPVEHWKAYLKLHLATDAAPFLSKDFVEARFDFFGRTLQGVKELQRRWRRAVNALNANVGELFGKVYVEQHFRPEAKARMDRLVENLRAAYKEGIDGLEWMGPETKKEAQAKLAAFRPKVGYPDKWRDYSALVVRKDDLLGNILRAAAVENAYQLGKAGKPVDPDEWGMPPQEVNAYYNPVRNEIVFPAAILQPPFFDMAADDAVNYGGIGAVIGHEMGHGFDDQGRRFDAKGVLRDWWTEKDGEEFERRTKGLVAQYSALEALPGLKVNGELTLGENIGDLTGVVIAHRAYQLSLGGKPAPVLEGLTGDQRFFIGWVQAWKSKYRDDALRQTVMADVHAPAMMRGNGPLRNVPAFYQAFDVKQGDGMFLPPEQRVKIW